MNKHVEKEYKMLVNKEQFDKLCSLYENLNFITQTNTYYDTVNGDIQKKKGAMRIRERNGRFLFTLKMRQENRKSAFSYGTISGKERFFI